MKFMRVVYSNKVSLKYIQQHKTKDEISEFFENLFSELKVIDFSFIFI